MKLLRSPALLSSTALQSTRNRNDEEESMKKSDATRLFNSSLDGNARRAIDIHEGEEVDPSAFKALVREAVALDSSGMSKPSKKAKS